MNHFGKDVLRMILQRLRKDLSRLDDWLKGKWKKDKKRKKEELRKKNRIKAKGFKVVIEEQKAVMMEVDGNGQNEGNSSEKQKAFCVQLKNRLCELMPSNAQLIRQSILHYVDSVMKRQKV